MPCAAQALESTEDAGRARPGGRGLERGCRAWSLRANLCVRVSVSFVGLHTVRAHVQVYPCVSAHLVVSE